MLKVINIHRLVKDSKKLFLFDTFLELKHEYKLVVKLKIIEYYK